MGPGSRALRALGRGHELLSLSRDQRRIPGRPRLVAEGDPGSMLHDAPRFHRCGKTFKRRGGFQTLPHRKRAMLPGRQIFISTPRAGTRARPYNALRATNHVPTTGVHDVQIAEISLPLTGQPQATSYGPQASSVTTNYAPCTTHYLPTSVANPPHYPPPPYKMPPCRSSCSRAVSTP